LAEKVRLRSERRRTASGVHLSGVPRPHLSSAVRSANIGGRAATSTFPGSLLHSRCQSAIGVTCSYIAKKFAMCGRAQRRYATGPVHWLRAVGWPAVLRGFHVSRRCYPGLYLRGQP